MRTRFSHCTLRGARQHAIGQTGLRAVAPRIAGDKATRPADGGPTIHYASPYVTDNNIGLAYNRFMALLPDGDFVCFTDGDTLWTTSDYGHRLAGIVRQNPSCRLFYSMTNRTFPAWQRPAKGVTGDDIAEHRCFGANLARQLGTHVTEVQDQRVPASAFLILLSKSLWANLGGFATTGILDVDWDFFRRAAAAGEQILRMDGIYIYHWYRGGAGGNSHLQAGAESAFTADGIWSEACCVANQVSGEMDALIEELLRLRPLNFMEIGTDRGGLFRAIGRTARPGGLKISLDLPRRGYWDGFDFARLHREMVRWFPGVHLIHADSHLPTTLERVRKVLGPRQLDFLFIDADHSYAGVKKDFEMYAPLVRPGGLVGFHDIVDSPRAREQGCHVSAFWRELGGEKREYIKTRTLGGIGIWVKGG